jgi:hypothetical protein
MRAALASGAYLKKHPLHGEPIFTMQSLTSGTKGSLCHSLARVRTCGYCFGNSRDPRWHARFVGGTSTSSVDSRHGNSRASHSRNGPQREILGILQVLHLRGRVSPESRVLW